jgi:hypothetical protein
MKVLSLRQPWAWMVVAGGKNIENRRWNTRFRGEFLIHAAKGMTRKEYEDAVYFARTVSPFLIVPAFGDLERGGLVGRARLVDVIAPCSAEKPCAHPWHMPAQFGFVLDGVERLDFVPMRGQQGFFGDPRTRSAPSSREEPKR